MNDNTKAAPQGVAGLRDSDFDAAMIRAGIPDAMRLPHLMYLYGREVERAALAQTEQAAPLQERVQPWMMACFGAEISADTKERNHRFLEEALELVQSCGCTASEAHQLVDYVFGRPVGEPDQEVGGVMITLAALCLANGLDMHAAGERELVRIWTMVEKIRAKQAAKPKHSPLPEQAAPRMGAAPEGWRLVPVEPTDAMLQAGHSQIDYDRTGQNTHEIEHESQTVTYDTTGAFVGHVGTTCKTDVQDAYRAMLAAAPNQTPAPAAQGLSDAEIVLAALETGEWAFHRHLPWSALTDEANREKAWSVERLLAPFCADRRNAERRWSASTALQALQAAQKDLGIEASRTTPKDGAS